MIGIFPGYRHKTGKGRGLYRKELKRRIRYTGDPLLPPFAEIIS